MAYSALQTAEKMAAPAIVIALVEIAKAIAKARGIELPGDVMYQIGLGGYAVWRGLINWIKNRRKR